MLRSKFLTLYASLPDTARKEIIVVIDGETFSWKSVYIEVKSDTKKSRKILKKLSDMGLI